MGNPLRYRDLVLALVARDLKVRYRRSVIGFLWTMLQPLLTMLVLMVVFSTAFRFDVPGYPVYALAGIVFWNFFQQSVVTAMQSLRGNAQLLLKVPVPRAVFPLATVLAGVVNLALALVPLLAIACLTGHAPGASLWFLPFAIVLAALFTLGVGLVLAPLAVFFYDIVEMVGVVLTTVMYLTPVFYPVEIVPARFRWLVALNPVRHVLQVFRDPIYAGHVAPAGELVVGTLLAIATLAAGAWSFARTSRRIPFYL